MQGGPAHLLHLLIDRLCCVKWQAVHCQVARIYKCVAWRPLAFCGQPQGRGGVNERCQPPVCSHLPHRSTQPQTLATMTATVAVVADAALAYLRSARCGTWLRCWTSCPVSWPRTWTLSPASTAQAHAAAGCCMTGSPDPILWPGSGKTGGEGAGQQVRRCAHGVVLLAQRNCLLCSMARQLVALPRCCHVGSAG